MQRYHSIDNDIDKDIFFNYYLGYKSGGVQGYNIVQNVPGSTKHREQGVGIVYSKAAFSRKAKRLAHIAELFVASKFHEQEEIVPPMEEWPTFTAEQLNQMVQSRSDKRTPMQKFKDELHDKDWQEYFIFFMYYDGLKADRAPGRSGFNIVGFNPKSGPPGSINHKKAFGKLDSAMTDYDFRKRGKVLADLAKEFLDKNVEAPEAYRPIEESEPEPLWGMIEEATKGLGAMWI